MSIAPRDAERSSCAIVALMPAAARVARYLGLRETATYDRDDMVASAYAGLVEAARRYDPARGASFPTFAKRVARWRVLDDWRRQFPFARERFAEGEYVAFVDLAILEDSAWEGKCASVEVSMEYLGDVFVVLTPRERFIIDAHFWHGLTGTEIARRLGVDQTGVNHSLRAALGKLRAALGEVA